MSFLEITRLGFTYPQSGSAEGIRDLSLAVERGQFISILGPSGSGKTTLLKLVGNLLAPDEGSVSVGGLTAHEARLRRMFSFVFQNPVLLPWRSVLDNVRLPLEILRRDDIDPGPAQLLRMVGLSGFEARRPHELSGGMRQRVALARALTFDPAVLLMDEPFGAVDELTREALNAELLRIWENTGVTVLFVTHSVAEAVYLSDRVVVLSPRPGTVKRVLDVPLPRPRSEAQKNEAVFQDTVRCLREALE